MKDLINKIASALFGLGVSADFLTYTGLGCALASAVLIYQDHFFWAGGFLLLSGGLDLLDGAVARQSKVLSPFGGILDSSLDRYGDGLALGAILFYCLERSYTGYALLTASALLGSFSISYVRARAECVVESCRVGFWERGERLVYISLALILGNLPVALWALGLGTHLTVLHRLIYARNATAGRPKSSPQILPAGPAFLKLSARADSPYLVKCLLLTALVLFFRLPF